MTEERQGRLLLVEDDDMSRDMLARRLERRGYAVEAVRDGRLALERLAAEEYDLVLLDWMMPGMTGLEVLERIRAIHPQSRLPVIMVTARAQSVDVVEALDRGANDYVTKPVDLNVALARIRTHIALKRSEEQIREEAIRDPLTGLYNRRHLMACLREMIESARRYAHPLACCMWDLDHYKDINDEHGHPAGDRVLAEVGTLLHRELRKSDHAARYGGDEFVMLFPHTDAFGAGRVVDRIRERLEAQLFTGRNRTFRVTGSFGIASYTPGMTPTELLQAADNALYGAKAAGRNCTHIAA